MTYSYWQIKKKQKKPAYVRSDRGQLESLALERQRWQEVQIHDWSLLHDERFCPIG